MAKLRQYVNLPRKELFVERGIESLDRLGPISFKVKLKTPDAMLVKFRTVMVSETSPYTAEEKERHDKYRLREPTGVQITQGEEVEADYEVHLPPSGGAVYKMEAVADGKVVTSTDEIETWRRLFFKVMHMRGVDVPDLQPTMDYYKTLFVELLDVPEKKSTEVPFLENARSNDLVSLARPAYRLEGLQDREPWVMTVVFAHALPALSALKIGIEPGTGTVDLPSRWSGNEEFAFDLPEGKYAWWGVNPTDDAANAGKGVWLRGDGQLVVDGTEFVVPANDISLDRSHSHYGGRVYNRIRVKVPENARNKNLLFSKSAKFFVKLWVLDGFAGGFALTRGNLLAVARNAWWSPTRYTPAQQIQVLNHEFGHKLGMVPKGGRPFGERWELDAPDKIYGDVDEIYGKIDTDELKAKLNGKGHRGAHCERGVTAQKVGAAWKWSGTPACTMFGATSTREASAPQTFCAVCAKLVIRQNLDPSDPGGPSGFKSLLE